jgi:hypothetical protein
MPLSAPPRSGHGGGVLNPLCIVRGFMLRRRHVPDRLEQSSRVEPVHPPQRSEFNVIEMPPRPFQSDHLSLEESDDGFGECIVVRIAATADRRFNPRVGEWPL